VALSKLVEYPGDVAAIEASLSSPETVDPSGRDSFGLTALMKFASWDKVDLMDLLLAGLAAAARSPGEPQSRDVILRHLHESSPADGFTALHHAADVGAAP
jgi:ankyrin repeat protein